MWTLNSLITQAVHALGEEGAEGGLPLLSQRVHQRSQARYAIGLCLAVRRGPCIGRTASPEDGSGLPPDAVTFVGKGK